MLQDKPHCLTIMENTTERMMYDWTKPLKGVTVHFLPGGAS